jgi:hypothetical protein
VLCVVAYVLYLAPTLFAELLLDAGWREVSIEDYCEWRVGAVVHHLKNPPVDRVDR